MALLKFVCTFAWTDLKVQQQERDLIMRTAGFFELSGSDLDQVKAWLLVPPPEDEVDPAAIPREHRELFLRAAREVAAADGRIVPAERDALGIFADLLADRPGA